MDFWISMALFRAVIHDTGRILTIVLTVCLAIGVELPDWFLWGPFAFAAWVVIAEWVTGQELV